MVQTYQVIAVLSGDIIGSTELTAAEIGRIRDVIRETVARFEYDWGDVVIGTPEFFSGDAWQLAMTAPQYALRLSVLIRAELRARLDADTRISIGIGHVEDVRQDDIALSSGEAFHFVRPRPLKDDGLFRSDHAPARACWPAFRLGAGHHPYLQRIPAKLDQTSGRNFRAGPPP